MMNFSIASFDVINQNLQYLPTEGSRCRRGPLMVLFWCSGYTSPLTIVAKIVFAVSRGARRRNVSVQWPLGTAILAFFFYLSSTRCAPLYRWFRRRVCVCICVCVVCTCVCVNENVYYIGVFFAVPRHRGTATSLIVAARLCVWLCVYC